MQSEPKTSNVVVRFNAGCVITTSTLEELAWCARSIKLYHNFVTVRPWTSQEQDVRTVFVIFPKSGHVNVSGIRGFDRVGHALTAFNSVFKTNIGPERVTVSNSTSSGRLKTRLDIVRLRRFVETDPDCKRDNITLGLRPHSFPGALLRRKGSASAILFANGKYTIIGAKSREEVTSCLCTVNALVEASARTMGQAT